MIEEIFENLRGVEEEESRQVKKKILEYIDTDELVDMFDDVWSEESFRENADEGEEDDMLQIRRGLLPKIKQARKVIQGWEKQLKAVGMDKYTGYPSLWWEGSDGWELAARGDSFGLESYLDEVMKKPELDLEESKQTNEKEDTGDICVYCKKVIDGDTCPTCGRGTILVSNPEKVIQDPSHLKGLKVKYFGEQWSESKQTNGEKKNENQETN